MANFFNERIHVIMFLVCVEWWSMQFQIYNIFGEYTEITKFNSLSADGYYYRGGLALTK